MSIESVRMAGIEWFFLYLKLFVRSASIQSNVVIYEELLVFTLIMHLESFKCP